MDWESISFGRFRLDLHRRELLRDGDPVRLHGRALDILCALVAAKGEVVGKDELMASLWPGRIVQESNIHVYVSALRKALDEHGEGHSYIVTVPGRGYRLSALAGAPSLGSSALASAQALPLPDKPSIAVMPFANLTGDPEQEYFTDGMVDEIITALSRIRWLFVVARNSSFTYKGQAVDVKQVGRELGVRYLLEGSVRKAGSRVRITAQLIEAETTAHLWADRFDGALEDVLDLQDQVAISVAGVIEPTLQAAESERSVRRPTTDLTAYDLYLRACAAYMSSAKRTPEALDLFEQAIERDPRYGSALGWAAVCCGRICFDGWTEDFEADRRKGLAFAQRALQVAADDPAILANVALALSDLGGDADAAIAFANKALLLNPSFARGWNVSAIVHLCTGETEVAIEHGEKALRLSPRARVGLTLAVIGFAHFFARRFEDAEAKLRVAIQDEPTFALSYRVLASCYAHLGQLVEARAVIAALRKLAPFVIPPHIQFRRPQDRELFLSGLRLATGDTDG